MLRHSQLWVVSPPSSLRNAVNTKVGEKILLSAIKETVKGGLAFGISSSLMTAIGFILIPLYTHYLSLEDFGLLGLIALTASIFSAVFGLGLSSAVFRSYFDYDDEAGQNEVISTALTITLISCGILIILSVITGERIIAQKIHHLEDRGIYFQVALFTSAINLLNTIPLAVYRAQKKFARFAFFNISVALIQVVLIVSFVAILNWGIMGIILGQLIATTIICLILFFSIRSQLSITINLTEVKKLLGYGIPLIPASIFYTLLNSGGLYFVQATTGLTDVGILNLAIKIASIFSIMIIVPFQLVWPPIMFSFEKETYAKDFYASILTYSLYISGILGLLISVFSPEIVLIISSQQYMSATPLIGILVIGHILFLAQNVFNVGFMLKRKTIFWSLGIMGETIASLLMWIILVPKYGILGIAIGSALSYGIGALLVYFFSAKLIKVYYEWKRILILLLLYFLVLWLASLIPTALNTIATVQKTSLLLGYISIPFFFKFWRKEEIAAVRTLIVQMRNKVLLE